MIQLETVINMEKFDSLMTWKKLWAILNNYSSKFIDFLSY